jgi:SAM-dependent methyltransferase
MSNSWYDDHAESFADAAAIELPFVGMGAGAQERLNRFKLWALDSGEAVRFEGKRVLDFGAGHGRLALAYPEIASYVGVDLSSRLVELGRRRLEKAGLGSRAQLLHADCAGWVGPVEDFDIVCSLGMFCHLSDPLAMLRKMATHLRPGGALFVDWRSASWLSSAVRAVKWKIKPPTGDSPHTWSPEAMERMLHDAGLRDVRLVMREYPMLAGLHAKNGWQWPLDLRNAISEQPALRFLASEGWAFARKAAR